MEGAATGGLYRAAYHSIPSVATCDQRPDASELRDSSKSFSSQSSPTLGSGPGPLRTCQNRRKRWAGALARRLASPLLVFLSNTKNGVGMYRHDSEKPLMRALAPSCNIYNIDAAWRTVPGLALKSGAYRSWRGFSRAAVVHFLRHPECTSENDPREARFRVQVSDGGLTPESVKGVPRCCFKDTAPGATSSREDARKRLARGLRGWESACALG